MMTPEKSIERCWVVFETDLGCVVSTKKLTYEEAEAIEEQGVYDFSFEGFPVKGWRRYIFGFYMSKNWTYADAERIAEHEDVERFERLYERVKRIINGKAEDPEELFETLRRKVTSDDT